MENRKQTASAALKKRELKPFVKWAGGKTQLLGKLMERMPDSYGTYYEPFIGGGALLLAVQPDRAVINDTNAQLLNLYRQLRDDAEAVVSAVNQLDAAVCGKERYLSVRERYNEKIREERRDAESAAMLIWLNKHCYNGLYRVNSKGFFNVPYNNRVTGRSIGEDNLRKIGEYLRGHCIAIREGDFETACQDVKAGDFVYFDSPYVPESATACFSDYTKEGFTMKDHRRLAALFRRLDALGAKLMLSNHSVPLMRELYGGYAIQQVEVRRAINRDASRRTGREIIVTNF